MSLPAGELEVATNPPPGDDLTDEPQNEQQQAIAGRSLGQIAWRRLRQDTAAMVGGFFALLLILVAIFAGPLTSLYGQKVAGNYLLTDPLTSLPMGSFGGANGQHWLGVTPQTGQDILAELIYGARTSLIISFMATALSLILGVSLGVISGYYRGAIDTVISRIMDLLLSFPVLLFSLALLTVFSLVPSFLGLSGVPLRYGVIIFVLGFFGFPYIGRIVRGQTLSLREKEFVDAARSLGASNWRIMSREITPNLVGPVLVYTTLTIPTNILGEAGLSYLGVGIQPPGVSWGGMLSDAGNFFQVDPTYLFVSGFAIFLAVMAFNLFGDGLRDAFDPRSTG